MLERTFDNLTAGQLKKLKIKTDIQRTDSGLISSNIRKYSRVQLLIEVLLRLSRLFDDADKDVLSEQIKPYSKLGSQKYVYTLKSSDLTHELKKLGKLYYSVYQHVKIKYSGSDEFRVFERVYNEHFTITEEAATAKPNNELDSSMLQSPDDEDATYRKKRDQESKGFTINATETANPDNEIQLLTDIAVNKNNIDDSKILEKRAEKIVEKTPDLKELHTDGGYGSEAVDEKMEENDINLVTTAVRGRESKIKKTITQNPDNEPEYFVKCPYQEIKSTPTKKRHKAVFDTDICSGCSFPPSGNEPGYFSISEAPPHTWDGSLSTAWNTEANWDLNSVPTSSNDVVIPDASGTSNAPAINITTAVCNNLTVNSGGILIINAGKALTVSGNFSNSGTFTDNGGTVTYDGVAQTIAGVTYGALTITGSGTKTLAGTANVGGALTIGSGTTLALGTYTATITGATDNNGTITVSTGTFDANGTFDATGGAVSFTGAGDLELGGIVTSLGTFTKSTSTVTYDGGDQAVDNVDYATLKFLGSTSASTKTFADGITRVDNEIYINDDITLTGSSADVVTVQVTVPGTGGTEECVFNLNVLGKTVNISSMTIKGGDRLTNFGGGIYLMTGTLNLESVTVSGSQASYGGGIYVAGTASVNINKCTIKDNIATPYNGGGVRIGSSGSATVVVTNSTFSNNSSSNYGGGFSAASGNIITITNSTFSDNTSDGVGGGISLSSPSTLTSLTIANNHSDNDGSSSNGGGLYFYAETHIVKNCIIANNYRGSGTETGDDYSCYNGTLTDNGYNVVGYQSGASNQFTATSANHNILYTGSAWMNYNTADLGSLGLLSTLALNSSTNGTYTLALGESSFAAASATTGIPYGSSTYWNDSPTADQRDVARVADQNTSIGAYSANYVHNQMTLEFDTDLSDGTTITLPLYGTVNVTVDWGDSGSTDAYTTTGDKEHTYASGGTYTVSITGSLTRFGNVSISYANSDKLVKVTNFGALGLTSISGAFINTANLDQVPTTLPATISNLSYSFYHTGKTTITGLDSWDVSNITNMSSMFRNAAVFNQDIGGWDVNNITDMAYMFQYASAFNQDIGNWERTGSTVGNVTNMDRMFQYASAFDQDIGGWVVSNVTNMYGMFNYAIAFNQDIGNWERTGSTVGNVTNMNYMFRGASTFNKSLNSWDVSGVTNIGYMFYGASAFNQPLNSWDVSNVTHYSGMTGMFRDAGAFNQDISGWDVSGITNMSYMFNNADAFNQDIGGWDVSSVLNMSNMFYSADAFNKNIGNWERTESTVGNVTNMSSMFYNADDFNQNISGWDVGSVENMSSMFNRADVFNQPLNSWDVSSVTNMSNMFIYSGAFNQDISDWDVSSVTDMTEMFRGASAFNQPLNSWDVSNVTHYSGMTGMFRATIAFNQDISGWNVGSVTNMSCMFYGASAFDQDISSWNVISVTDMSYMFYNASAFDQDIGNWNVSSVTNMSWMFYGVTLSTANYNSLLIGWNDRELSNGVIFSGGNSKYSSGAAATARQSIIDDDSWTITDDGMSADITWAGSLDADWNTADNWSSNTVPTSNENVIVPNVTKAPLPVIANDGTATCTNLTINSWASLTIQSSATGTGSLIVEGTATGDVIMQRYMNEAVWTDWEDGWHFLSSPVTAQAISSGGFTTAPYDFYCWWEPTNEWVNFKNQSSETPTWPTANVISNGIGGELTANFKVGKGYMAAYDEEGTKSFTGTLNNDNVSISGLTITGGGDNRSWHLLGNPYSCGLTWDGTWNLVNITGTAEIWNEDIQSYSAITSGVTIPATNGFMVQVSSGTGSLTIPKAGRVHGGAFYKNVDFPVIKLKANNIDYPSAQESQLLFNPQSTNEWDLKYDGDFLPGYAPYFYSKIDGQPMAVNSMPNVEETTTIPFTFIKNEGLNFSIEMYEVENMAMDVWLLDRKLNKTQNLSLNPVYIFTAFEQDDHDRFVIHFSPLGIDEPTTPQELIHIWSSNKTINILNTNNYVGDIKVLNMLGQNVLSTKLTGDKNQILMINVPSGYYIINTITQKGVVNKKLYLR